MIITIFIISGTYGDYLDYQIPFKGANAHARSGPQVWDSGILTVTHLDQVEWIAKHVRNLQLNEGFMIFGAFALAFNITTRCYSTPRLTAAHPNHYYPLSYSNVYRSCRASKKSVLRPLLFLLPFPVTVLLQVLWLLAPGSLIVQSSLFVPFLCAWGLQFAHQVGRMILAHVTGSRFPYWNWLWVWFAIGALDANAPKMFGV